MELDPHERQIAEALAEHRLRSRDGAPPPTEAYEARLGPEAFAEFKALLDVEHAIDRALGEDEDLVLPEPVEHRPPVRLRPVLRRAAAIAAVLLVCVLAWTWSRRETALAPPGEVGSEVYLAYLEREVLDHERPQTLVPPPKTRYIPTNGPEFGLLPAGRIRPADLAELQLILPELADLEGRLVFRRPDGTPIHEQRLLRTEIRERIEAPDEVLTALATGGEAVWGYETDDGSSWILPIEVLPPEEVEPIEAQLAEIRARTASLPAVARAWIESSFFLDQGLPTAAYVASQAASRPATEDGASLLPWLQRREALHRVDQWESPLGAHVHNNLVRFPGEELAARYEARSPER